MKNSQTEANKRWQKKNRERTRYLRDRSTTRNFIRKKASGKDIEEILKLIEEKKSHK
ncbi:hypothetical protein MTZ62_001337 [Listeria monocytogenes]|nr:hypothetical protein [Listeria monocytogenes]